MNINKNLENNKLTLFVEGRLDTITSPELEEVINSIAEDITELTLDFSNLEYLSSAGLRVILIAQKKMNLQGNMTVCHVNEMNMEVFNITGFDQILHIV